MASPGSVDPHLTLRRVERQHALIEELRRRRRGPSAAADLGLALGVTERTVERDVRRLRDAGIPIRSVRGPGGGYLFDARSILPPLQLEPAEAAALVAALVALGPSASESASSSMDKLVAALTEVT